MVSRIGRYARSALDLADNLLRLVRAESIDVRQFVDLDLALVAQEAMDEAWVLSRARQITMTLDPELGDEVRKYLVRGDRNLLRRAVLNLLSNAIKYSPKAHWISILIRATRVAGSSRCATRARHREGPAPAAFPALQPAAARACAASRASVSG